MGGGGGEKPPKPNRIAHSERLPPERQITRPRP
jgi:hypothetical protein